MSRLEKIVFLADHIEEGRDYPEVARMRQLAFRDLEAAIVATADATLQYLIKRRVPIDPATIATRNSYLKTK